MFDAITYYLIPNIFISAVMAFSFIRPHLDKDRILAFIGFALLGVIFSFITQYILLTILWFADGQGKSFSNQLYNDPEEGVEGIEGEQKVEEVKPPISTNQQRGKKQLAGVLILAIFIIPLFFHFFPSKLRIVAKEYPTYRRTIVTQKDIDDYIDRSNNGEFYERLLITQDPFFKLLVEEGFIVKKE